MTIPWKRRRAAVSVPAADPRIDELASRAERADAGLREAHERSNTFFVHSGARDDALGDRLDVVESRLAELEVDRSRLREALRAAPWNVENDVAYWRRRLGNEAADARSSVARHGEIARVVTDVGPLLLPAHDEVMLSFMRQFGEWEKEESDRLRSLLGPGMTFVDVGAHVGYMSALAARAVGPTGRVYAFEPEPGNFRLLQANLANLGIDNVHAVPAAAWHESGRLSLSLCTDNTGDHRAYALPGRDSVDVAAFALDDILPDDVNVDVVKVDAQATDDLAIRGMERTLARSRPVLVVEFWPDGIRQRGDDPMAVLQYYRDLRYDLSLLGGTPAASLDAVLNAALTSPTEFCSLVLTPCA